jgi:hypothetical protein
LRNISSSSSQSREELMGGSGTGRPSPRDTGRVVDICGYSTVHFFLLGEYDFCVYITEVIYTVHTLTRHSYASEIKVERMVHLTASSAHAAQVTQLPSNRKN